MVLTQEQRRVYDWLNDLKKPVFAQAYKGAIGLLNEKPAGYISFVCHAGRDLMNLLAPEISGIKTGRVDYVGHVNGLQMIWRERWGTADELSPGGVGAGHLIPVDVCEKISLLINEHKSGQKRDSDKAALFFSLFLDYSDKDKIPKNLLTEWNAAKKWFLKHVHLRSKAFRSGVEEELEKHFKCLDGYLSIAATSHHTRLTDLNEILDATNR